LVAYIDVDDTLVRSIGSKRIPIPEVVKHVKRLHAAGAELYCWSTGGAAYARATAAELGVEMCFVAFLPKPNVVIDDQPLSEWRYLIQAYPLGCSAATVESYLAELNR
jgi:predicted HAD superfamily phosphohydrolase YqeG